MFKLLKKELLLTACPLSYIFIASCLMAFIPDGYPITLSAFFLCLGIFYSFEYAREYNDILFTALLPIKKSDVVLSKFAFTILIEACHFVLSLIFTLIIMLVMTKIEVYNGGNLLNANIAYLGYLLLIYAFFNIFFLGEHFKTAYNIGIPFVLFIVFALVIVSLSETLHHVPSLEMLNGATFTSSIFPQFIVFIIGLVVYVVGTLISLKLSEKRFENIEVK